MEKAIERRHYIDNIRWATVLVVVVYHILYMFNSVGVITNITVQGIPQLDAFLAFVYPWFMCLMFVIAGMSAKYSLKGRTGKQFMKNRAAKLLVPSIVYIFTIGWLSGWVTNQYNDMFQGAAVPGFVKYLIYCLSGIGPMWFAQELFLASAVLMLVRKIDKNDKLTALGEKVNMPVMLVLAAAVWGSANIFNTPMIEVYRNGIYIFMFLLGYYVFSHEKVTDMLMKFKLPLLAAALIMGIAYTVYYYGENYADMKVLKNIFTNVYCWTAVLAVIGCAKAWADKTNKFAQYMKKRSFGFYVLHYTIMVLAAYFLDTYAALPIGALYLAVFAVTAVLLPIAYEIIVRIPVINKLLLAAK